MSTREFAYGSYTLVLCTSYLVLVRGYEVRSALLYICTSTHSTYMFVACVRACVHIHTRVYLIMSLGRSLLFACIRSGGDKDKASGYVHTETQKGRCDTHALTRISIECIRRYGILYQLRQQHVFSEQIRRESLRC